LRVFREEIIMFDLYRSTQIGDVTTYVRPYQTISTGPLEGPNTLTIFEEKIIVLPDASIQKVPLDTPEIQFAVTDPNEVFNIVHPVTGVVTGTMTLAQLKIQMYSLYLHMAAARDAADAANAVIEAGLVSS
jgi:hypothetical protein